MSSRLPTKLRRAIEVARARMLEEGVPAERLSCPRISGSGLLDGVEVMFRHVREESPRNAHVHVGGLLAPLAAALGGERLALHFDDDRHAFDPIELDPSHNEAFLEADALALEIPDGGDGTCHVIWDRQASFLASRGIAWRSPSEMNPGVSFD